jgi:hypothetical protein
LEASFFELPSGSRCCLPDIQGLHKAYPKAGDGFRHINLHGEALLKVCYHTQCWLDGKWFVPASELNGGSSDLWLDGGYRET